MESPILGSVNIFDSFPRARRVPITPHYSELPGCALDNSHERPSILIMRAAVLLITMVFTLAAASGLAQQQALDTSKRGTNSGALTRTLQFSSLTAENTP